MTDITRTAARIGLVHSEDSEVYPMVAGVAIGKGQAVYVVTSTGLLALADANDSGAEQIRGIALNAAGIGGGVDVCKRGMLNGFTLDGNYDSRVYLSNTVGELADAVGTMTVPVGRVMPLSDSTPTKVLYVDIDWLNIWT